MRPGEARDMADIEQAHEPDGDPLPDFDGVDRYEDVPCHITMTGGAESFRGRGIEPSASHVVELQYLPNITPRMRLNVKHGIFAGRTLNIVAVVPIDMDRGRARKLQLDCREVPVV